jgi:hypothetical protein
VSDDSKDEEIAFGPEIAPGVCAALRRSPDGEVRRVVCTPMREGASLAPGSEVAHVGEATGDGAWRKLTRLYKVGPAQVATPEYREGSDRIFGKKQKAGLA